MKKMILVIEDDDSIRTSIAEVLKYGGYDVAFAENGQVALDLLRGGLKPHLIMLDLMMPVMDGPTFRTHQRQDPDLAKIPVVVISANSNIKDRLGPHDTLPIIRKPPDIEDIISMAGKYAS